jgi:hypothetical protein
LRGKNSSQRRKTVAPARPIAAKRPIGGIGLKTNSAAEIRAETVIRIISRLLVYLCKIEGLVTKIF